MIRTRSTRGMTLLEVLVANAIFALFIVMALDFMSQMSNAGDIEYQSLTLEQDANNVLDEIVDRMRAARITPRNGKPLDLDPDGTPPCRAGQVCFQLPVDHDEDGDTMKINASNGFEIEWGAVREDVKPADYLDGRMVYQFSKDREFNEADRKHDLNGDGDMTDEFDVGHIEIEYPENYLGTHQGNAPPSAGRVAIRMLSGNSVIRVRNKPIADIDGNGTDDPMFELNSAGSVLTITIFTSQPEALTPLMRSATTKIDLRNDIP